MIPFFCGRSANKRLLAVFNVNYIKTHFFLQRNVKYYKRNKKKDCLNFSKIQKSLIVGIFQHYNDEITTILINRISTDAINSG